MTPPSLPALRQRLELVIFGTETTAGRVFDIMLLIAILGSVGIVMIDSVASYHSRWSTLLHRAEIGFTVAFTAEYLTRIWCTQRRVHYILSFWGLVDLIAILPTYLALLFPGAAPLTVIRLLRMLRVFRVLHLFTLFDEFLQILRVLRSSARSITVFAVLVMILLTIFGSLLCVVEGPGHGFSSIPMSIYWATVTITTVGYGDVVPQTPLGRTIASGGMLIGYSILAVPTAIITAKLWERLRERQQKMVLAWNCPVCAGADHASDAEYCKHCGAALDVPEEVRQATQTELNITRPPA